ncbi:MAG: hypothetical protein ACTTHM_04635 [Peptoanaerobacter stomatis]
MYRPILEGMLTYTEASNMSYEELEKMNIAIDLFAEKIKKSSKK